jgi:hypothetical protein
MCLISAGSPQSICNQSETCIPQSQSPARNGVRDGSHRRRSHQFRADERRVPPDPGSAKDRRLRYEQQASRHASASAFGHDADLERHAEQRDDARQLCHQGDARAGRRIGPSVNRAPADVGYRLPLWLQSPLIQSHALARADYFMRSQNWSQSAGRGSVAVRARMAMICQRREGPQAGEVDVSAEETPGLPALAMTSFMASHPGAVFRTLAGPA